MSAKQRKGEGRKAPCTEAEFKRMVQHLRTVAPPPSRCSLSVVREDDSEMDFHNGYVIKEHNKFYIYVARSLTQLEAEQVLIHEWAHMLAWRPYHPLIGDHGADWGVWYAKTYSKYYGVE